jgi:hypothetical protein
MTQSRMTQGQWPLKRHRCRRPLLPPLRVHDRFWAEDGPFHKSTCLGAEVIIIASHSVRLLTTLYAAVTYTMFQALQQDFSLLYAWTKPKGETLPWTDPRVLPTYNALAPKTLYGRSYLSVTIDEAHTFRDIGAKHSSALLILKRSTFRIIMTATPLPTSTKVRIILNWCST